MQRGRIAAAPTSHRHLLRSALPLLSPAVSLLLSTKRRARILVSRRVPFPLLYSTAPGCTVCIAHTDIRAAHTRCTVAGAKESAPQHSAVLSRSHGSSSGSGGDIPTYLPTYLSARLLEPACRKRLSVYPPPLCLSLFLTVSPPPPSRVDPLLSPPSTPPACTLTRCKPAPPASLPRASPRLLCSLIAARQESFVGRGQSAGNVSNLSRVSGQFV